MRSRLDRECSGAPWPRQSSSSLPEPRRVQFTNNLLGLLLYAEKQLVSLVFPFIRR